MTPDHLRGSQGHRTYSRRFLQGELFWDVPIEIIGHSLSPCPERQRGIDVVYDREYETEIQTPALTMQAKLDGQPTRTISTLP